MNNEPVAWMSSMNGETVYVGYEPAEGYLAIPLYTHPASLVDWSYQQGYKVGKETHSAKTLTDFEIKGVLSLDECWIGEDSSMPNMIAFARAILRKAQEK